MGGTILRLFLFNLVNPASFFSLQSSGGILASRISLGRLLSSSCRNALAIAIPSLALFDETEPAAFARATGSNGTPIPSRPNHSSLRVADYELPNRIHFLLPRPAPSGVRRLAFTASNQLRHMQITAEATHSPAQESQPGVGPNLPFFKSI